MSPPMIAAQAASVAVIVINWNAGVHLERCLRSALGQTVPPKRVIVVDNASSDGSASGLESKFPGIEVIRSGRNLGFAAGNNAAARKAADCKWLALINPDAFAEPDWLEKLLDAAEKNPEFSFFGSKTLNAGDPSALDGAGDVYHASGLAWRRGFGISTASYDPPGGEIFSPCAAAAMYKSADFLEAGGFDESYFCYLEDVDLGFRLRLAGRRCLYVKESAALHVGSAATARHSDFTVYHGHRNLVWTFVKNMPAPLFWLYLPQHLFLNLVTIIIFALRGQGRVIIKAKLDAIKGLPEAIRKRRSAQASRVSTAKSIHAVIGKNPLSPYLSIWRRRG